MEEDKSRNKRARKHYHGRAKNYYSAEFPDYTIEIDSSETESEEEAELKPRKRLKRDDEEDFFDQHDDHLFEGLFETRGPSKETGEDKDDDHTDRGFNMERDQPDYDNPSPGPSGIRNQGVSQSVNSWSSDEDTEFDNETPGSKRLKKKLKSKPIEDWSSDNEPSSETSSMEDINEQSQDLVFRDENVEVQMRQTHHIQEKRFKFLVSKKYRYS